MTTGKGRRLKHRRDRFGIDVSNIHREIRDPLWPLSAFRVLAGVDIRRLLNEIQGSLPSPGTGSAISLSQVRFGGADQMMTFHCGDMELEPLFVPKTQKMPVLLDFLKGLTRRYSISVAAVNIVGCNSDNGDYEIRQDERTGFAADILTLSVFDQLPTSVSVGSETIRFAQGAMWCFPEVRHMRIRPAGRYLHAHFDVR